MSIVNGRLGDDHGTGKFTCFNSQGASVIDYLLLNKSYFNVLNTFNVCDFNEYSDHAPLHVSIVCTTVVNARDERSRSEEYVKWSDEHKETYRSCLIGLLSEFNRLVMNNENDSPANINNIVTSFTTLIRQVADPLCSRVVKKKPGFECKYNDDTNKWFDQECRQAKALYKNALHVF